VRFTVFTLVPPKLLALYSSLTSDEPPVPSVSWYSIHCALSMSKGWGGCAACTAVGVTVDGACGDTTAGVTFTVAWGACWPEKQMHPDMAAAAATIMQSANPYFKRALPYAFPFNILFC
jgi:hypothetical protein